MEETWEGDQLFHEQIPLPIKDEKGPPLIEKEVWKKRDVYWLKDITAEEFLQWVVDHLQRKRAVKAYRALLLMYWRLCREDELFSPEYMEGETAEM
ncbi:MAG: hypothetical protein PVF58_15740 [Candidatus Methanofastidiosia archaeon]